MPPHRRLIALALMVVANTAAMSGIADARDALKCDEFKRRLQGAVAASAGYLPPLEFKEAGQPYFLDVTNIPGVQIEIDCTGGNLVEVKSTTFERERIVVERWTRWNAALIAALSRGTPDAHIPKIVSLLAASLDDRKKARVRGDKYVSGCARARFAYYEYTYTVFDGVMMQTTVGQFEGGSEYCPMAASVPSSRR